MDKLNFIYYTNCNVNNISMLLMSIDTLLKFNKIDNLYIIFIYDKKFDLSIFNYFKETLKLKTKNFKILKLQNFEDYISYKFPDFPNAVNNRLRYFSLSRFLIGHNPMIDLDYFWYSDNDILFNAKIDDFFKSVQKEDLLFYFFNRKLYSNEYTSLKALNGGLHFFNLKLFRKLKCLTDLISFYKDNGKYIQFINQDGFSYLARKYKDKVVINITDEYNINPVYVDFPSVKAYHFNGNNKHNNIFEKYYRSIMEKEL